MFFRWYCELRSDGPLVVLSFCTLVVLSFHPSVRKSSWDWLISFFLKLSMVLEVYVLLCVPEPDFFCPKNGENGPKIGFLGFIGKFSHHFFLNLVYKKRSYYLLYSSTNPILWKNLVPDTWAKMLLVNQIAGFLNWLYLQNRKMKKTEEKPWWKTLKLVQKYRSGPGQKWVWQLWPKDTKIGFISKRN